MKKLCTTCLLILSLTSPLQAQSSDQLIEDLLNTWDQHVAMTHLLLKDLDETYLSDTLASGGRNVGEQLAHMHNVRMNRVFEARTMTVDFVDVEIDNHESEDKQYLTSALLSSDSVIRWALKNHLTKSKPIGEMSATRFMGYLISHESHTRGQIVLALKQSGHALPPQIAYGIWQW